MRKARYEASYWWVHPDKKERFTPQTTLPWTIANMLKRFPDSIPRRNPSGTITWILIGGIGEQEQWNRGTVRFDFKDRPDALFNQEMHAAQRRYQLQEKKGQTHDRRRGSPAIAG